NLWFLDGRRQILRNRMLCTACCEFLRNTAVARERVGRMFWVRFGSLMRPQMSRAVLRASASLSDAYRWKYDFGFVKALRCSFRNRSSYQVAMSDVRAST